MNKSVSENTAANEADQESTASKKPGTNQVRSLAHPLDTVSGATADLFEVRPAGKPSSAQGSSSAFKAIAVIAIVVLLIAIVVTQFKAWG